MVLLLVCVSLAGAGYLRSEILHLKDGSVLRGRLVKMELDTLYFETSFGSKVAVHREKVVRIDLDDRGGFASEQPSLVVPALQSAEPGTLAVSFDEFEVTSRIVIARGGHREAHERENAIEQILLANGKKIYSLVDSLTDKTVRKGPETVLRNEMRARDFEVALAPGVHRCVVAFGNPRASVYIKFFDPGPLDKKIVLDPVRIEPGQKTHVRIGMKRKWTGKTELFRIE